MFITRWIPVALVAIVIPAAYAATLTVPGDAATIQEAIDAAAPGDTVLVKAGTYAEPLILKSGVSLEGEESGTIVVGDATHPAVTIEQCEDITLESLTFTQPEDVEAPDAETPISPVGVVRESRVRILKCVFEGGGAMGLAIDGVGNVEIRDSVFRNNACNGVFAEKQSTVTLHRCDLLDNGRSGVVAKDPETRMTLGYSTSSGNGWSGMNVYYGGNLIVDHCRAIDNKGYGICVQNIGTHLNVTNSTVTGNSRSGVYVQIGSKTTFASNTYEPNGEINEGEIGAILRAEDFASLETIAARLRTDRAQFPSGGWQIDTFYSGLVEGCSFMSPEQEAEHLNRLERWKKAVPGSVTWRIALATSYRRFGWRERGPGYAIEVTPEGWVKFHEYLRKAQGVLDDMKDVAANEPEYYELLIEQAREYFPDSVPKLVAESMMMARSGEVGWDSGRQAFDAGIAVEREYLPLYHAYAWGLLPRWGGSPAQYVAFAEEADALMGNKPGACMQGYLALLALSVEKGEVFSHYPFSWEKIRDNFANAQAAWPESTYATNGLCRFACYYADREEAVRQFEKLGDTWNNNVWHCKSQFTAWRQWALEDAPKPGDSDAARAATAGSATSLQAALDAGGDPNGLDENAHTLLQGALMDDQFEVAQVLLENGADPDLTLEGATPNVHIAVEKEDSALLELLLKHGANPDMKEGDGWSVLTIALNRDKPEVAKLLLDHGADPNLVSGIGAPPMILAIYTRFGGVVAKLIERGADVNARSEMGATPLSRAVYDSDVNMVAFLLEKGADPNIPTYTGFSCLMTVAENGNLTLAQALVEGGAQVDYVNPSGWTAIHQAAGTPHTHLLEFFLSLHPNGLNSISKDGMSVLQYAVEEGRFAAVKLLVERGADVNYRNPKNELTPLSYAILGNHTRIKEYLEQQGAKV